jgi:hypothetical protein
LLAPGWPARAQQDAPPAEREAYEAPPLTPQQLDDLVAPIALYPDPLVGQILAAATYPLEIVQADRWLQANRGLQGTALTDAARDQPWDPSVQALVVFPSVLDMLDRNLAWTINLGNAFLAQAQEVMDAIQRQRQRALSAGQLGSSPQQVVQQSTEAHRTIIEIVPPHPDVVYVPVYDPVTIWGPPIYQPWAPFWYPPPPVGAVFAAGFVGFFVGFAIAPSFYHWGGWGGWGWGMGWHHHAVVVNNTFHIRNNYRLPHNHIRSGPSPWSHDPRHRGGVAYPSRGVAGRVGAPAGRIPPPAPRPGGPGMVITRPPRVEPRPAPPVGPSGPGPARAAPSGPAPGRSVPSGPGRAPGAPSGPGPAPSVPSGPSPARGVPSSPGPAPSAPRAPLTPQARPPQDRGLFGGSSVSGPRTRIESDRGHGSLGSRPSLRPAPAPQVRPSPAPQRHPAAPQGRSAPGGSGGRR